MVYQERYQVSLSIPSPMVSSEYVVIVECVLFTLGLHGGTCGDRPSVLRTPPSFTVSRELIARCKLLSTAANLEFRRVAAPPGRSSKGAPLAAHPCYYRRSTHTYGGDRRPHTRASQVLPSGIASHDEHVPSCQLWRHRECPCPLHACACAACLRF